MGLHGTVRSSYLALGRALADNRLLDYKWFLEQEADTWKHPVDLSLSRRLWLYRRGFISPTARMYDFATHGPAAYVSELQMYRLYRSLNGDHRYLVDDKLSQHWMLCDYPEHRPEAFGLVDRGVLHGVAGTTHEGDPVPVADWLPGALRERGTVVLKHLRGHGGKEVHVCEYDGEFRLDGEPTSERALCEAVADLSGYLATAYVRQHAYADRLYPHAANTVRILTLWDEEAEELVTPIAVQRIGTEQSRPVDNFSSGGLTAEIDVETGELGPATRKPFDGGELPWHATHPDTGAPIEGTTVANWDAIRATVEDLARDATNLPALGWDVILDEGGEPVVIEANTGTDVDVFQVHRPLLADPRVAAIAARHLPGVEAPPTTRRPERRIPVT